MPSSINRNSRDEIHLASITSPGHVVAMQAPCLPPRLADSSTVVDAVWTPHYVGGKRGVRFDCIPVNLICLLSENKKLVPYLSMRETGLAREAEGREPLFPSRKPAKTATASWRGRLALYGKSSVVTLSILH